MDQHLKSALESAISIEAYKTLFEQLVAKNKTTGPNQSEGYVNYTKLNWKRYQQSLKNTLVTNDHRLRLKEIDAKITLLIITEAWCGDAAQILPVIEIMARFNCNIDVKVVLRDEHEALMNQYLTNGGKAIPKALVINHENEVIGDWGPRPSVLQAKVKAAKEENPDLTGIEISHFTQDWYKENRGKLIIEEMLGQIKQTIPYDIA